MKQKDRELIQKLRLENRSGIGSDLTSLAGSNRKTSYDFHQHPAYKEARVLSAASQTLGIGSPFFRQASAIDGSRIQIGNAWHTNYCSYDYLGLNQDPRIAEAVTEAVQKWGVSATASRIVGGERSFHGELESALAGFLGVEAALTFVSGHATNVAILRTLIGKNDVVFVDALAHNSIYEGIIASGATHVCFSHNSPEHLSELMESKRFDYKNALIATEGLFSMDGDLARLDDFIALKQRYDAWLLLDEAHSFGVVGETGKGIAEETGIALDEIDIVMGTLSKSLCASGGFVAGSHGLIDLLKASAPGFVYSVGLSAPIAAAALKALEILTAEPERVTALRNVSLHFQLRLQEEGIDQGTSDGFAIAPVIVGDSIKAVTLSNDLLAAGINAAPIITPAVPEKSARLRFFLTANHSELEVDDAISALVSAL